ALGLEDHIVGISHECDTPARILDRPRVSSTKVVASEPSARIDGQVRSLVRNSLSIYQVDEALLERLAPDLIFTQDHCAVCAVTLDEVEAACRRWTGSAVRVISTRPESLQGIRDDFRIIAEAAGVPERGAELIRAFDARLESVRQRVLGATPVRVALVEWIEPPMIAGGWMPELAELAGARPVLVEVPGRFLTVSWERIAEVDPDVVLVMPCG